MTEYGVGVIGYGFMGKMHTYGYNTIPLYYQKLPFKTRLVGLCSDVADDAEAAAALGYSYFTEDWRRLTSDPAIHIINICTPNVLHKEMILGALRAGKHVYCDKPLTASSGESEEVLAVLGDYPGQVTQVALQQRFYPATMLARRMMDEDKLGRLYLFRASYLHSSGTNPGKVISWKQDKRFGGGGALLDLGAHTFDLMYYLLGEYKSVYTMLDITYAERPGADGKPVKVDGEDTALTMVRMKSGAKGIIENTKVATGTLDELRFEIHGEKGALRYNTMDPGVLEFYDNTVKEGTYGAGKGFLRIDCMQKYEKPGGIFPNPAFTLGFVRPHVHSLYNFLSCVHGGVKASPSFAEGAYIQRVMESCYRSADQDKWIEL